jgi:hypothetical protein
MKAIALFAVAGLAAVAQADIVAYWNFNGPGSAVNTFNTGQLGTIDTAVTTGTGSISLTGLTQNTNTTAAANGNVGSFGGSTTNAVGADVAGFALSITGGIAGAGVVNANGGAVVFAVPTTGFASDLVLTYVTRGTGTGFNSQAWDYSTDGGMTWTAATTFSGALTSTFVLRTVTFPTTGAIYGNANFLARLTVTGASNASGNNRIDNVRFDATVIPTPGAAALMGVGLIAAGRRRR